MTSCSWAGGAVVTSLGETKILTTTTASSNTKEFLGFFPLTVEFEERMYANGRIPGSFFKREGRPSEDAILPCRLTDRPLRPTFAEGLRNEIQVVNTVLQTTQIDPYDVVAMNGASLATMLAGIPFEGPTAATRVAIPALMVPAVVVAEGDPYPVFFLCLAAPPTESARAAPGGPS